MTKKLFDSLVQATRGNTLFDWLHNHSFELTREEIELISRELAYALQQPNSNSRSGTFICHLRDFYDAYGFDSDDHDGEDDAL